MPEMHRSTQSRNSQKVNLVVSALFHAVVIGALFYFAAREGMLGKKLKTIAVTLAPKEKEPEKLKPKAEEPKPEPQVQEQPKVAVVAQPVAAPVVAPPASGVTVPPAVAPPSASLPSFDFSDGAKAVETSSNPVTLYKGLVEYALRSRWVRPEGVEDEGLVAEVEVSIDPKGSIVRVEMRKGSGNAAWDESVKKALAQTRSINRVPPKGFPGTFMVRFDVQVESGEAIQ